MLHFFYLLGMNLTPKEYEIIDLFMIFKEYLVV